MINSIDIYRAIKELLKEKFTDINILTNGIKTPTPPCFYINSVADNFSKTATDFFRTIYVFSIVYFSDSEETQDLLTIKDSLKQVFLKPLKVCSEDSSDISYIDVKHCSIRFNEENTGFNATIRLEVTQRLDIQQEDAEENDVLMEDMVFKLTKGG